jgi:hypothetical protein
MTIFSTFPPRFTLLNIITTQCHLIIRADESALLRTNVHWLELTWDTWPDSQKEAKGLHHSERAAVGLTKNRRPNQIQLINVQ